MLIRNTLGFDLDGVCCEFFEELCKRHGRPLAWKYRVEDAFPKEIAPLALNTIMEQKTYRYLNPVPGAAETLHRITEKIRKRKKEYQILYVTSRPAGAKIKKITTNWLKKHNFPFPDNVVIVGQDVPKPRYVRENRKKFIAFVEDSFNTCFSLIPYVPNIYCFDRIWNAMVFETPPVKRVLGWNDLYELLLQDVLGK